MADPASFSDRISTYTQRVQAALDRCLQPASSPPTRLHEAMRYSVLNGGKRVRATLVMATADALSAADDRLDAPACAVELIHAYSLVHDDLPSMDNDDLRRGVPTCHRAFDEATALLAGDALQTLAFEVLAREPHAGAAEMARVLAAASGSLGMAGGQAIDLEAVGKQLTFDALEAMHLMKTGALIAASVRLGALCAQPIDGELLNRLDEYAHCIGLAFQIRDDVLDVESDTATLGKTQGADAALDKPTYPAIIGLDASKRHARALHERAVECLVPFGSDAFVLRELSAFIVERAN